MTVSEILITSIQIKAHNNALDLACEIVNAADITGVDSDLLRMIRTLLRANKFAPLPNSKQPYVDLDKFVLDKIHSF